MKVNVLTKIINYKKEWIKFMKFSHPFIKFQNLIKQSTRNFYNVIVNHNKTIFILECKKASPSNGIIRKTFNPLHIAKIYKKYATIISVVTDEKYFQGSLLWLSKISNMVNQPILCKDFFIDPYQIYLARFYQADAILLMLSTITDENYRKLSNIAHSLNMGILTEVTNEQECKRALLLGAKVIGINNRNLYDFSIDLNKTIRLSKSLNINKNKIIISESGINNYGQIRKLSPYVNGFLIGSSLMKELDINFEIKKILWGENKICGLTNYNDANIAYKLGSTYGGLIFIKNSPRYISHHLAHIIISNSPLRLVGVFSNTSINNILTKVELGLSAVQLHGKEDQKYINELRKKLPKTCNIWKALDLSKGFIEHNLEKIDRYLLDNKGGGSGTTFNWNFLKEKNLYNSILAGGLNVDNCSIASSLGCIGLDFNSGIEILPGIKDHHKMNIIFSHLRDY